MAALRQVFDERAKLIGLFVNHGGSISAMIVSDRGATIGGHSWRFRQRCDRSDSVSAEYRVSLS
jgi:hypothetical protein